MNTPRNGFWKRFSLRALFVMMTLCCVLLGLWSVFVNPFRRQAESLAALQRLPVEVTTYPARGTAWQRWLVTTMLGEDAFVEVDAIELRGPRIDDAVIKELSGLRRLRSLTLEQTEVTDAGLLVIGSMRQLQALTLTYSLVTDRGINRLKSLPELSTLKLTGTQDHRCIGARAGEISVVATPLFALDAGDGRGSGEAARARAELQALPPGVGGRAGAIARRMACSGFRRSAAVDARATTRSCCLSDSRRDRSSSM